MSKYRNRFVAAAAALALGLGVLTVAPASQAQTEPGDEVRLNEIQVIGTHNSYKVLPSPAEQDLIRGVIGSGADAMQYQHVPLGQQFANQKVRQIELDVWVDSAGGRYSEPLLRSVLDLGPYQPEIMDRPGIKAFHIQDVDYGSTCPSFVMCLQQVKAWSDANPGHVPLAILVELKDTPLEVGDFDFTEPEPWTAAAMDELDADIRSVFPDDQVITPDDIRDGASTLREAVTTTGWPTLGESRGKVMFTMDNGGGYRSTYRAGRPSLQGRMLFTNAEPADEDAAFIKRNDPFDPSIPGLVSAGFLVRTRSDGDTVEARTGDTSARDAALASGAQWVSTDYPVAGMAVGFTSSYVAEIPGGTVARCNPVNGPEGCVASTLDRVSGGPVGPPPTSPTVPGSGSTVPGSTVPGSTSSIPGSTPTTRPVTSAPHRPASPAAPVRGTASYAG